MSTDLSDLMRLNKSQVKPAAEVLTRAFHNYPMLTYYFPDEIERDEVSIYFFQSALYSGHKYGELYATSSNLEGVAVWLHSDNCPLTFWQIIRSVPLSVILNMFSKGVARMMRLGDHMDKTHKRLAPFKHWFLEIVGVAPQFQGSGCASKLLLPMLVRIDKEGLPCYVDTIDEQRISLYQHFGFEVLEKSVIPGTDLSSWAMMREAR